MESGDHRLVTRVALKNYKSIAACDVRPAALCFLLGPNGSGKSNFLDALRFVADSLRSSLDHALRDRGGINEVRRRSGGHPTHFSIRIEFCADPSTSGHYAFKIGAEKKGGYSVQLEECLVRYRDESRKSLITSTGYFQVRNGRVWKSTFSPAPALAPDRLYLVNVSGLPQFRPVFDALVSMGFYNLNPDEIRDLQPPDSGDLLRRDGGNISGVLASLSRRSPETKQRVEEYLRQVVPGTVGVRPKMIASRETLEFRQEVKGATSSWKFPASSMSDGTLRALGVLVALFQAGPNGHDRHRLIGIEEPETALHPAAAGILRDALTDASTRTQVLVTSHSPDLLDDRSIPESSILAVFSEQGETRIGRLDPAGRSILREHLYTAGELLRMDQLRPDPCDTPDGRTLELFGPEK